MPNIWADASQQEQTGEQVTVTSVQGSHGRSPILVVAGSIAIGFVLAIALVLGPASGATEAVITGSVLLAFGIGWLLLAVLSVRFTDQPQRWAFVPAAFMGVIGLALVVFAPGIAVMDLLSWFWPPALLVLVVWMWIQFRRDLRGRSRWLLYPAVGVYFLFAVGGGLQTVLGAIDQATHPMTGELVDVDGHKLHIECAGTGAPTVVFESGLAQGSAYWGRIASAVAPTARVCIYDRAGRGWSEPASGPQDGLAVATDLHALLAGSGNAPPYVMVGHSTGGPYVRIFAVKYPDEVAGMVLLDSQPPDAFTALPQFASFYSGIRPASALFAPLARLGVFRLALASEYTELPSPYAERERADQSTARLQQGQRDEFAVLPATLTEAMALTTLGDKPLVVVTAEVDAQPGWLAAQMAMVGLSTNSAQRVASDQDHGSLIMSEQGAALSSRAILDVLASIRTGVALAK
jgi:pimeloyl-ACP methyl ester carboxylesterase